MWYAIQDDIKSYHLDNNISHISAMSYEPLSHSRHNAGDRIAKVGHEISWLLVSF